MKRSKQITRVLVAFVFTFLQLTSHIAQALTEEQRLAEMLKNSPPGSSAGVNTGKREVNGVTIVTKQYWSCAPDGKCDIKPPETYMTTIVLIQRDGHFYAAEMIDRVGDNPNRVAYSTVSGDSPTGLANEVDPATVTRLDLIPGSRLYSEVVQYLPQVASAVSNTIQNMNQIATTSEALQQAYKQVLNQVAHAADGAKATAQKREDATKLRSQVVGAAVASTLTDPKIFEQNNAYQDYLKSYNNPYSFKQYDLNPTALKQYTENLSKALQARQPRVAIEQARVLLNQRDPSEARKAKRKFAAAFQDGVAQTKAFGAKLPSPFDDASFGTRVHTPEGQVVRNIANKAQAVWIESRGLETTTNEGASAYLMGSAALRSADEHFASGDRESGFALAKIADGLFDLTRGFFRGGVNGVVESAKAFPILGKIMYEFGEAALNDPEEAIKIAGRFVESIPGLAQAMVLQRVELLEKIARGNAEEKGEAMGQLAGELLVDWLTDGTVTAVRQGTKGLRITEKMGRLNHVASTIATQGLQKTKQLADELVGPRGRALMSMARRSPQAAVETVYEMGNLLTQGRKDAAEFMGKALANGSRTKYLGTPGNAEKLARSYIEIEDSLKAVEPTSFSGKITRGVPASIEINGSVVHNSVEDVFTPHSGMKYAEGRYSIGGPEGESAIYASLGDSESLRENIVREIGLDANSSVIYANKEINLSKGLDLSNTQNLEKLGLSLEQISRRYSSLPEDYLWTQILGHASRKQGFDFIIAPSAIDPSIKNIIIYIK